MRPESLVACCTTSRELEALAYALFSELGARASASLLRNAFFVNGNRSEVAAMLEVFSDVSLGSFDEVQG